MSRHPELIKPLTEEDLKRKPRIGSMSLIDKKSCYNAVDNNVR